MIRAQKCVRYESERTVGCKNVTHAMVDTVPEIEILSRAMSCDLFFEKSTDASQQSEAQFSSPFDKHRCSPPGPV
jgi:hypothetical protein